MPIAAVATLRYELEQPTIWRRSRLPTITLKAGMIDALHPATAVDQPIAAGVPLMLFIMATILMIQLQSFQRLFLVFAVAPLALIGVVAALLTSRAPLGFVAILGVLALIPIAREVFR